MRISIEWFLLDNWLMNMAALLLGAAMSGLRFRKAWGCLLALLGAVYALLALWKWELLLFWPFRILFATVLALGLCASGWRAYLRATLCVLLGAACLGGLMLMLSYLEGQPLLYGAVNGALVGTRRLRVVLVALPILCCLPRFYRWLRSSARVQGNTVALRIVTHGTAKTYTALLDTGNLLTEPFTGLPVALLDDWQQEEAGLPVPYHTMGGAGEVLAYRPERAQVYLHGHWQDIDIMVAQSPRPIADAQAILGGIALPPTRVGCECAQNG